MPLVDLWDLRVEYVAKEVLLAFDVLVRQTRLQQIGVLDGAHDLIENGLIVLQAPFD